jgi:hypothetical protein
MGFIDLREKEPQFAPKEHVSKMMLLILLWVMYFLFFSKFPSIIL